MPLLQDSPGSVLKLDAVPSVFDGPGQPQTGQVSHDKEMVGKTRRHYNESGMKA